MHVRMVLETLQHHKLFAKAAKCQFGRSSVGFLGHITSEHGVAVDPRKVAAVAEWATPRSCTDVRPLRRVRRLSGKLLSQFCVAILCPGRPPDDPLQPPRPVCMGRCLAAEI